MTVQADPRIVQLLLKLELFRGLTEEELQLLLSLATLVEYDNGDYIIREGEQDHNLFVLLAGSVRIYKRSFAVQKAIKDLGPGECFGEMSLIDCRSRSASVRSMAHQCKVLRIDGDKITELPGIITKLYRNIAMMLSQRLRHANDMLTLG
jgi:CRP-like cAMP-binding protein